MLQEYHENMRGTDLLDQMVGYFQPQMCQVVEETILSFDVSNGLQYNTYTVAHDSNPDIVKQQWPSFKDYLEQLCMDLTGDTRVQRDALHVNEIMPST